jgi:hypothetical protein
MCGAFGSSSQHRAVARYRSLALEWLNETLAFTSTVKAAVGRCLVDSIDRRGLDPYNKMHLWFTETRAQCKEDSPCVADQYFLTTSEDPMFTLEVALRVEASVEAEWESDEAWWQFEDTLLRHANESKDPSLVHLRCKLIIPCSSRRSCRPYIGLSQGQTEATKISNSLVCGIPNRIPLHIERAG